MAIMVVLFLLYLIIMPKFSKNSLDKLKGVHPDLVRLMHDCITDCPIDFTIFSGVRTTKEQQDLYALGRTKINPDGRSSSKPMGNKVTNADGINSKSNHQVKSDGYGYAVDIYPYIGGIQFNDVTSLRIISAHIKARAKCLGINIVWGGDFKTLVDMPHFELKK